jgi:hypothetical protein
MIVWNVTPDNLAQAHRRFVRLTGILLIIKMWEQVIHQTQSRRARCDQNILPQSPKTLLAAGQLSLPDDGLGFWGIPRTIINLFDLWNTRSIFPIPINSCEET